MQSQTHLMYVAFFAVVMIVIGCSKEYKGSNEEAVRRIVVDARRGDSGAIIREFSQSSPWIVKGEREEYAERLSRYISRRYGADFIIAESASGKGLDGKNFEMIWITNDHGGGRISFLFLQNGPKWGLNSYSIIEKDTNDVHFSK